MATHNLRYCAALAVSVAFGCQGAGSSGSLIPEAPSMATRCRVGASQTSLLVTEWPGAEKANLEAMMSGGAVAVNFSGCAMRLVPECQLGGNYSWRTTTVTSDLVEVTTEAELYTKVPLGAVSLSGELQRSGSLYIETTVSGQMRLAGFGASEVPNTYECAEATHVVSAVSLGAFVLSAGGQAGARAAVDTGVAGEHGGARARSVKIVRSAGSSEGCAGTAEQGPPLQCGSPVQAFLSPIPGRAEVQGPPGSVKVDFVSGSATTRWDVYVDDEATCTTPCAKWVDPSRPVVLKTRTGTDKLRVGQLDPGRGPLQISAVPTARGKLATGIVFTSLGGLAVISGITLAAVGCTGDDRGTMCDAGAVTGVTGAIVVAGAVWLLLDSLPKVRVRPIFGADIGVSVLIGPGIAIGRF